jgi:hypothetical protein
LRIDRNGQVADDKKESETFVDFHSYIQGAFIGIQKYNKPTEKGFFVSKVALEIFAVMYYKQSIFSILTPLVAKKLKHWN